MSTILTGPVAVQPTTDAKIAECNTVELVQDYKEVVQEWQWYKEDSLANEEYATDLIWF